MGYQPSGDGGEDDLGPVVDTELVHHVREVALHRPVGQTEFRSHLPDRSALGDKVQNPEFAPG